MNWIAEQFEKLKARVEAHIPAVNSELNSLGSRVDAVERDTQSAVAGAVSYVNSAVTSVENRVKALELLAEQLQKAGTP